MADAPRKDLAKVTQTAEPRIPVVARLKRSEIALFKAKARELGIGWTTYLRECALTGYSFREAQDSLKTHSRITA